MREFESIMKTLRRATDAETALDWFRGNAWKTEDTGDTTVAFEPKQNYGGAVNGHDEAERYLKAAAAEYAATIVGRAEMLARDDVAKGVELVQGLK